MGACGNTISATDACAAVGFLENRYIELAHLLAHATGRASFFIYFEPVEGNGIEQAVHRSKWAYIPAKRAIDND